MICRWGINKISQEEEVGSLYRSLLFFFLKKFSKKEACYGKKDREHRHCYW